MDDFTQIWPLDPPPLVLEVAGELSAVQSAKLNELLHSLQADGRRVELHLPDASQLPPGNLAACVFAARRVAGGGGKLVLVAGAGVAESVRQARLSWLLPVQPLPVRAEVGLGDSLAG